MLTRTAETLESLARELDKKGHHTTPTSTP